MTPADGPAPVPPDRDEDLDLPPSADAGRLIPWERILGLLLVGGLLIFGLGQWWDQQGRAGHYRAGAQAVTAQDWDGAQTEFAAAAGYADAPARQAAAQSNVTARDHGYSLATAAAGRGDWVAALQALEPLQTLAPHYRGVAALHRQALAAAVTTALTGAVALRLNAQPPGLYRFGAGGWHWLLHSDAASQVQNRCPTGAVLLDVPALPGAGTLVLPPLPGAAPTAPAARPAYRQLELVPAGDAPPVRLTLDPDPGARYLCTGAGVWTTRSFGVPLPTRTADDLRALAVRYQAASGAGPVTPTLPGPSWYVVAVASEAPVLLAADTAPLVGPAPWRTRLYAAPATGGGRGILPDLPGTLVDAQLSPDGHYALLTLAGSGDASGPVAYTTVLLDATGRRPAVTLESHAVPAGQSGLQERVARFLQQPPRAGQVLLSWEEGAARVIRVIDPGPPARTLLETRQDGPWGAVQALVDPASAHILILGPAAGSGDRAVTSGVEITPGNGVQPLHLAVPAWSALSLRVGDLLALSMTSAGDGSWHFLLESEPRATLGDPVPAGRAIYSDTQQLAQDGTVPLRLAPNWLIYRDAAGALHGRSYDGGLDLRLPEDASGFPFFDLFAQP